ncbi:2,5-diketo-D-gluconic acid reductase [Methanobrevibacter sp. YE315]|uniref:aldo/keto reductase n=1 Tax=Methanobrevibacter sp. YE315 TaxID=1609968 RepID=UPI000764D372|nr:aldo/keto reductase [Methanobrevibacter sp. YE315]AMD17728.1 2,5-diketo-D-gluconic acid reductase [Methanobrevibacter sp. YE315]
MEYIKLNDGLEIPAIGFGTFLIPADGSTYKFVKTAIDSGIRHIDTATAYFNEQEVGQAVKDSEVEREDIWITSKLWLQDYEYEDAKKAIDLSLEKLGTDYMDLYLLHQPYGKVDEGWRALEEAKEEGKIRSIGVSNMTPKLWNKWVPDFDSIPSVNQVEFNPYMQQNELKKILKPLDVKIQAWGPLGQGNADLLNEPAILEIAEKYGKNAGQVILRFENQEEIIVFPKSTNPERIKSNMEIFDFELTDSEINKIRALDTGKGSHDPDAPGVGEMLMNAFDVHAND